MTTGGKGAEMKVIAPDSKVGKPGDDGDWETEWLKSPG